MTRVLSVSSSRADVGILSPVWAALAATAGVELDIFLTGMHMGPDAADPGDAVPGSAKVHRGGADLGGAGGREAADAMGRIGRAAAEVLATVAPDVMLVIGDRLDMLPAAMAALPFGVPMVHLHGGEVTEGAIDNRIRHALSQLADAHCVSSEDARDRLISMGIDGASITVTGAPGLDTLRAAPVLDPSEFATRVGLPPDRPFRLVTVHPETTAPDPLAPLAAILGALAERPGPVLFTAPNSDPGGAEARRRILDFCETADEAVFVDTLGPLYPSALRNAALMLGNSSSGVIEAGVFGLPVLDVGDRQTGRLHGANVVRLSSEPDQIVTALDRLGAVPVKAAAGSPYGDGAAGPRVAGVVIDTGRRRQ